MPIELVIRTRRFETFHLGFRSLRIMEHPWINDSKVKVRVLVTTLRNPQAFATQFSDATHNLIVETFYRDLLLFEELSRRESFEIDYIYLDDPSHRLPNNRNIYPYVLHRSLENSHTHTVFSLDDDIIYLYPGLFSEIENYFHGTSSIFGMYLREDRGMKKLRQQHPDIQLGHSAFLYAKGVEIDLSYFLDFQTSAGNYADADAGKFVDHPAFVDLHTVIPRWQHPERETLWDLRTNYFYHVGSVGCTHSSLVSNIYESSKIIVDSLFIQDLSGGNLNDTHK